MGKEKESSSAEMIKDFRVWYDYEKCMYFDLEGFIGENQYCTSIYTDNWISGEASRFTGFYCKEEKIYEGDVLGTYCYNKEQVGVVEMTREGWKCCGYHLDSGFFVGGGESFKILGNIFANPELCKN